MRRIGETFRGIPLVANMARSGRGPMLGAADLAALGYRIALSPVDALLAATHAMRRAFADLRLHGAGAPTDLPMVRLDELSTLMGAHDIDRFDARWSGEEP